MLLTILQLGLMCYLLEICIKQPVISEALGGNGMVFHLGLMAFGILYSPLGTVIGVLMNILSRKNLIEWGSLVGVNPYYIELPKEISLDIDDLNDFSFCENIFLENPNKYL